MKSKILNYSVILQKESDVGFTVTVPTLPGCVTYGKDVEEAKKMAIEAIELYLESLREHNEEIPEETETYYTQVTVSPSVSHA